MNANCLKAPARCLLLAAAAQIAAMSSANALNISFDAVQLSTAAGSTVDFSGEIQNDTFNVLATSLDLFLNFSSYDPTVLSPTDLLPLSSATLPIGSTSASLPLISVDVAPATHPGLYELQVSMQDVFGGDDVDASPVYTLFISVVPEPSTYLLMLVGMAAVGGARGWRKTAIGSVFLPLETSEVQP